MACVVLAVIITMSILFGAELGPKADPTTTTYTPRPEWYFFFLFELLRVVKPPELVFLATIGIPTICLVLLLLLPFIDRNPERNPLRRPIAMTAGIATIAAMAYLTILGALAGSPTEIDQPAPPGLEKGQEVMASSGCLGCHKVGENGNTLGPNLTEVGSRLGKDAIARTLVNPTPPMPSYAAAAEGQPRAVQPARPVRRLAQGRVTGPPMSGGTPESGTLPDTQVRAMFDRIAARLRPHELGDDRRDAPPLARAGGGPRAGGAGLAGARRGHGHGRPRASSSRAAERRSRGSTSRRRCSRSHARRRRA